MDEQTYTRSPLKTGPAIVVNPNQNLAHAKYVAAKKNMTVITSDLIPYEKYAEVNLETFRGILP